jgi:hypothetical protein
MELSKLIPQLFFDVIARMMPGSAVLVGWAIAGEWKLSEILLVPFGSGSGLDTSAIFFVFVFLGASYVVGHLLGPLSQPLESSINWLFRKKLSLVTDLIAHRSELYPLPICEFFSSFAHVHLGGSQEEAVAEEPEEPMAPEENAVTPVATEVQYHTSLIYIWLDWLRLKEPDMGARLVKIRAEVKMQSQLAVASLSVVLFHFLSILLSESVPLNVTLIVASFAASLLAMTNYHRLFRIFQLSIINHCYAIGTEQSQFKEKEPPT